MPENLIIPSVDVRIGALEEYNRRQKEKVFQQQKGPKPRPCVTLSREFGCEGYPVAERLLKLMAEQTGDQWVLIDKDVLDEVANRHHVSREILEALGTKNRVLSQVLATFSERWKTDHEYFELLCSHIVSLAEQGNVIIVGLGGAIITHHQEHCYDFRIFGSREFKINSICQRMNLPPDKAADLIEKQQSQIDRFTREFLFEDESNPALYDLLFNNDRMGPDFMARTIADYVAARIAAGTVAQSSTRPRT